MYRYEKRQALKTRFEIEQKLRRERKATKKRTKDRKDDKRLQLMREKRSKVQDRRSKAIDELKAKRSAGMHTAIVYACSSWDIRVHIYHTDKIRKAESEKHQQLVKKEPLKASEVFSSGSDEESSSSESSGDSESDDDVGAKYVE